MEHSVSPSVESSLVLVMGGARSGKSTFAEKCAEQFRSVVYVATAHRMGGDGEMDERIAAHQARRPSHWQTLEPPAGLEELVALCQTSCPDAVVFDCATLWLGWEMSKSYKNYSKKQLLAHLESEVTHLVATLGGLGCPVFVVSNETGCGIVPEHQSGRLFRDLQGILNARLAERARIVCLCMAGMPLLIKNGRREETILPVAVVGEKWVASELRGAVR